MSFVTPTTPLLLAAAYLLGSIPFGLILAKLFAGSDIRKSGSGNIGATNVARVAGPAAGILTLALDAAKGSAAVWLAGRFTEQRSTVMTLAGIIALLGHCFPIWLKFKGGKGVATALGVFLILAPLAALASLFIFIVVSAAWRYVSLGSVSAAASMPLLMYFLWAPGHAPPLVVDFGTLFAVALVIFKHDANLQRLIDGEEPKFSFGKSKGDAA
ncbi:MAG TPA: glycerol-3-phosphate 1-O-acyltransferase PlsY [Candidatus Limnocylindrales bacterium]|nr:glycerol-3-phosphate 1-O-acyltransferase PlsY [Candidatus Limnocylindrales bacterium]